MTPRFVRTAAMVLGGIVLGSGLAHAQTTVVLPNSTQTTLLTANVSEQARVTVPSGVTFNVTNIAASTVASAASVTVDNIALATASKQLKVSLKAAAAGFTPPVVSATTWSAGDVTWNAGSWTAATPASGTLDNSAFSEVATCDADAAACSTSALVFTLAPNSSVQRSGNHTLSVTWKFESL